MIVIAVAVGAPVMSVKGGPFPRGTTETCAIVQRGVEVVRVPQKDIGRVSRFLFELADAVLMKGAVGKQNGIRDSRVTDVQGFRSAGFVQVGLNDGWHQ